MMSVPRTISTCRLAVMLALCHAAAAFGNNIRVNNVATQHKGVAGPDTTYVVFDLSWENSWRTADNWDAAWVFIKFRAPESEEWEHALLATNTVLHQAAPGSVIEIGTTDIDAAPRGIGAFIYRDPAAGYYTGSVNYARTRLVWDYGQSGHEFPVGAPVDVSVHALEMVYVAQGAFYLGSGGTEPSSFTDGKWAAGATFPYLVTNEAAVTMAPVENALWAVDSGWIAATNLPASYPKGYAAFYCMKYMITQGQYADFLNKLTAAQATERRHIELLNRHTIRFEEGRYVAGAPDRSCNYLSWADGTAYADWAGLRPMSEFEYEKACRGPESPVANEYAWGTSGLSIMLSGEHDPVLDGTGTELAPENRNSATEASPVRAGIFAANATSRQQAGASYWGIQDLTCYPTERAVSVSSDEQRAFTGLHGDGALNGALADVDHWPTVGGHRAGRAGYARVEYMPVSCRLYAGSTTSTVRDRYLGFRAVRTAP